MESKESALEHSSSSSTLQNAIHALSNKKSLSYEDIDTLDWISRDHIEEFFQNESWAGPILTLMTAFLNGTSHAVENEEEGKSESKTYQDASAGPSSKSYKRSLLRSLGRLATSQLGCSAVQGVLEQLNDCFDAELSGEELEQGLLPMNAIAFLVLLRLEKPKEKLIQAQDLLNFADWNVQRVLAILLATLQLADITLAESCRLARLFHGLTTPSAWLVFDGEDYNCAQFSENIDRLMQECLSLQVIEGFASFLASQLAECPKSSKIFGAVGWTLQAVYNLFLFSKFSTALRGSLSINSNLTNGLIIPYMRRCIDLLEEVGSSPPAERALALGLKLGVSITFRQKVLPCLRNQRDDLKSQVCGIVKQFFTSKVQWTECRKGRNLLIMMLMMVANLNLLEITEGEWEQIQKEIFVLLRRICESMAPVDRQQILLGLEQPKELPISRDSISYRTVWAMYARFSVAGSGMLRKWAQQYVSGIFETFNLSRSSFNANYAEWENQVQTPSAKDSPDKGNPPKEDGFENDLLDEKDVKKECEIENQHTAEPKFRLLGDLPSFVSDSKDPGSLKMPSYALQDAKPSPGASKDSPEKKESGSYQVFLQEPENIPEEFLCSINRHVMKEPVTSPQGFSFEKETIDLWLRQQGSVCPITQQELNAEELEVNLDLQNRILEWKIQTNIQLTLDKYTDDLEGDDLYDF